MEGIKNYSIIRNEKYFNGTYGSPCIKLYFAYY